MRHEETYPACNFCGCTLEQKAMGTMGCPRCGREFSHTSPLGIAGSGAIVSLKNGCPICGAPGLFRDGQPCEHHPSLGVLLISAERTRQVKEEGYTPERDAQFTDGSLAQAAAYYCAVCGVASVPNHEDEDLKMSPLYPWRWCTRGQKREGETMPTDKDLIKAGALIAAELDRRAAGEGK